jgi:hypothetical protein
VLVHASGGSKYLHDVVYCITLWFITSAAAVPVTTQQ